MIVMEEKRNSYFRFMDGAALSRTAFSFTAICSTRHFLSMYKGPILQNDEC
jgi:hypothetical protein